ncbi:MAG: hypothetical protein HYW62_03335 [Candidatus Levybacteria bacterium]|nr:hypothetical protein [Candidatus Levybacteria bacterium]
MRKQRKNKNNLLLKLRRLRFHHRIIFTLLGTMGIVLIWRGTWNLFDKTPLLNDPLISILAGLLLVILSGIFFKLI